MVQITSLMDDRLTGRKDLLCEHGLSMHVACHGKNILFDCGSSEKTLYNAQKLGLDLSKLDAVVLSHAHYDHAGGFRFLAQKFPVNRLYTGPGFFAPKYAESGSCYKNLSAGFEREFVKEKGIVHRCVEGAEEILPGVWAISGFPQTEPMETIPERFLRLTDTGLEPDDFHDEVCLALETDEGLVLLAGCAHPGILNMTRRVNALLGKPITAIFGGTHLVEADAGRIEYTVDALCGLGLKTLGLSHCSGEQAEALLRQRKDVAACRLGPGDCVFFAHCG